MHKQLDVKNYFYSKECCLGASLMDNGVSISTYYSGNGGTKFSKKIWLCQKFEGIDCWVGTAASSIRGSESRSPNPHVKGNCVFLGR